MRPPILTCLVAFLCCVAATGAATDGSLPARKLLQLLSPRTLFGPGSAGTGSVTPRAGGETDPGLPLGGTTAPSNVPGPASGPLATNGNGIPCPDQTTVLDLHNSARAARGASPLQYSDQLAQDAATWSGQCKKDGAGYAHADDYSTGGFGESLGWFQSLTGECKTAIETWLEEQAVFSPQDPTNFNAQHFTQVVWKATTQVGCGIAKCGDGSFGPEYLVTCRYLPPGNGGDAATFTQNV